MLATSLASTIRGSLVFFIRPLHSAIPSRPVIPPTTTSSSSNKKITDSDIEHLERLSLVDFGNVRGIQRLEEAIAFAQPLKEVDTTGVEPLYTVLEDQALVPMIPPKEDPQANGNVPRPLILANAKKTEEDYFVAPPGNIPLKVQNQKYKEKN